MTSPLHAVLSGPFVLLLLCLSRGQSLPAASRPDRHAMLGGEVLDPAGKPAAGVRVHVMRWPGEGLPRDLSLSMEMEQVEMASVVTDDAGRWRCAAEPGRLYGVWAERADLISTPRPAVVAGSVVVLELAPAMCVAGRIVVETGHGPEPVGGAVVEGQADWARRDPNDPNVPPWSVAWARTTTSGADGAYRLVLPAGASPVRARQEIDGRWFQSAMIRPGGPTTPDLLLRAPTPRDTDFVRFQLVDRATGRPIAGARCGRTVRWRRPAVTDAEGRFDLAADQLVLLQPREHELVLARGGAGDDPRIAVDRGLRLRARLRHADGRPLAGARVLFTGPLRGGDENAIWETELSVQGELDVGCLQKGMPIHGLVEVDATFVSFVDSVVGADLDLGDVRVTSTALTGRVLGDDGAPVAGARVLARHAGAGVALMRSAFTDHAGWFALAGAGVGPHRIAVASALHQPAITDVPAAGPQPLVVRLERGDSVSGRVVDKNGAPVAGAEVHLGLGTRHARLAEFLITQFRAVSSADGRFTVTGLPPDCRFDLLAQRNRRGEPSLVGQGEVRSGDADVDVVIRAQR